MCVYCRNLCLYREFSLITEQLNEQPPQGATGQVVDLVVSSDTSLLEDFKYSQSASKATSVTLSIYPRCVQCRRRLNDWPLLSEVS